MCAQCAGTGWIFTERNGLSGAERCPCSVRRALPAPEQPAKPTAREFGRLFKQCAELIPFFPQTAEAWALIQEDMERYVADSTALELFRVNVIRFCKKYEGPAGLRQIYCGFATPADGVYPLESLPGVNAGEAAEARYNIRVMEDNERRIDEYKRQALLDPPGHRALFLLEGIVAEAKPVPSPPAPSKPVGPYSYNRLADAARIARSLKEREKGLAEASRAVPARSEEERARLVREVEQATGPLRAALAGMARTAQTNGLKQ